MWWGGDRGAIVLGYACRVGSHVVRGAWRVCRGIFVPLGVGLTLLCGFRLGRVRCWWGREAVRHAWRNMGAFTRVSTCIRTVQCTCWSRFFLISMRTNRTFSVGIVLLNKHAMIKCFDRESNTGPPDNWWYHLQSGALPTELSKLPYPLSGECRNRTGDLAHAKHALYQLS